MGWLVKEFLSLFCIILGVLLVVLQGLALVLLLVELGVVVGCF